MQGIHENKTTFQYNLLERKNSVTFEVSVTLLRSFITKLSIQTCPQKMLEKLSAKVKNYFLTSFLGQFIHVLGRGKIRQKAKRQRFDLTLDWSHGL